NAALDEERAFEDGRTAVGVEPELAVLVLAANQFDDPWAGLWAHRIEIDDVRVKVSVIDVPEFSFGERRERHGAVLLGGTVVVIRDQLVRCVDVLRSGPGPAERPVAIRRSVFALPRKSLACAHRLIGRWARDRRTSIGRIDDV